MRCIVQMVKGEQCRNRAESGSAFCRIHIKQKSFVFDRKLNDQARTAWKEWRQGGREKPMPRICHSLVCGAKTRKGTPCKRRDLYGNSRCPLHGGLSTGPKTVEGKKRSSMNLPWRKEQSP